MHARRRCLPPPRPRPRPRPRPPCRPRRPPSRSTDLARRPRRAQQPRAVKEPRNEAERRRRRRGRVVSASLRLVRDLVLPASLGARHLAPPTSHDDRAGLNSPAESKSPETRRRGGVDGARASSLPPSASSPTSSPTSSSLPASAPAIPLHRPRTTTALGSTAPRSQRAQKRGGEEAETARTRRLCVPPPCSRPPTARGN